MKNYLLLFTLILVGSSCKRSNIDPPQEISKNTVTNTLNITDPNDPNLNPNWQWWQFTSHNLYYSPTESINNVQTIQAFVPFHTQGNILNSGPEPDMYPEDGWVLAYKDFGTPTRPISFPFFALYNKYRGIFRVMLYNAQQAQASYMRAELSFVNTSHTGGLMTFNAEGPQSFLNSYNHSVKDHQITYSNQFSDWLVYDFNLSGYDPNYSPNAAINLQIFRVDETAFTLNSTAFTLKETVEQATPGGQGSSFLNAVNTGYNIFNTADKMVDGLKESPYGKEQGSFFYNLVNSSYIEAIPVIGKALGIIRGFIGGGTKPAPRQPLKFTGTLNFSGTSTSQTPLYSRTFALSASSSVPSNYKPVQNINWGIFNIVSMPQFAYSVTQGYDSNCQWYVDAEDHLTAPINFISNHAANGMILKDTKIGIITNPGDQTRPIIYGNSFNQHAEGRRLSYGETADNTYAGKEIGIMLTYEIINPTKYLSKEIKIFKVYPAMHESLGTTRRDDCINTGPGIEW